MTPSRPTLLILLLGVLAALLPVFADRYMLFVGNSTLIYLILSIGLNVLIGYVGQLAFMSGALFGVGAYATALLRSGAHLPYWLALPLAALATAVVGLAVALPALRLTGLYLALTTVAFAQFATWVFLHWDSFTGGPGGLHLEPVLFGSAPSEIGLYYLSLALVAIVYVLMRNLLQSAIGRAFVAIRESDVAAESLSIDLVYYKTMAYVMSAFCAGLAGGLFAALLGLVVPESFDMFQVILQFAMVVTGGLGSLLGSVIGGVAMVWLQESLRAFKDLQEIAFGGLILLVVLFLPGGVTGLLRRRFKGWREPLRRAVPHD